MFDLSKYTVDVYIDHNHGYAGFESDLGQSLFGAEAAKWDAFEFIIHSPSEHTVDGKRFDMEIQIFHNANHEEEVVEGEEGEAT
jgi:carbonic anhydrase